MQGRKRELERVISMVVFFVLLGSFLTPFLLMSPFNVFPPSVPRNYTFLFFSPPLFVPHRYSLIFKHSSVCFGGEERKRKRHPCMEKIRRSLGSEGIYNQKESRKGGKKEAGKQNHGVFKVTTSTSPHRN